MSRKIDVSIILPVYNETARLVSGLSAIVEYLEKKNSSKKSKSNRKILYELIMIDDGSNIPASEVINHSYLQKKILTLMRQKKFRGYRLEVNQGKGRAIATGIRYAKGEIVVFTDIDGSVSIQTLPKFLQRLKNADIVIGSRRVQESVIAVRQSFFRETGGRLYTLLSQLFFGLSVRDVTCGFKVFKRNVARDLFSRMRVNRWAFDTEILALALQKAYIVVEIPVVWSNKEGTKVKIGDTIGSFVDLLRILWNTWMGEYEEENRIQKAENRKGILCDSCGNTEFRFLFDHHNNWKVRECNECGLAQVLPRPSKKEVAALYKNDQSHFDPYIEQEQVHRKYFNNKLTAIRRQLSTASPKLLDIGCLTGVLLDEARNKGIVAEGIDISKDAVRYCRNVGLLAYEGTIEEFHKTHPRKKYDGITAFEIIEHEYSPRVMVETMYRMLHNNGIAMVTTPNHGSWWRITMGKRWPGYTHPEHLYFFDRESLRHMFTTCGFKEVTITTGDGRPFPLWYLFKRGADYFPRFAPLLKILGLVTSILPLQNPLNPWDDLLIVARK